jgi:biotin-(acetyl-CoA carboxylase) ligase
MTTKDFPDGFLFVCSQQTQGIGRTGNKWLSPKG